MESTALDKKRKDLEDVQIEDSVHRKRLRFENHAEHTVENSPRSDDLEPKDDAEDDTQQSNEEEDCHPPGSSPRRPKGRRIRNNASDGPQQDLTTGQRSFFPGLDDSEDEAEDSDNTTSNALAYLRSVRNEASLIPHLLTRPVDESEREDEEYPADPLNGYYSDGAYIAAAAFGPELPPETDASQVISREPQDVYHERLCAQFAELRRALQAPPTAAAVSALPDTHPITFPPLKAASADWGRIIRVHDPLPAQIACMDKPTLLRLLRLCSTSLKRKKNIKKRQSMWIWAVLAKLDDVGTLVSEEVSVVRELGKRAVFILCGFESDQIADATEQYGNDEGPDSSLAVEGDEAMSEHVPSQSDAATERLGGETPKKQGEKEDAPREVPMTSLVSQPPLKHNGRVSDASGHCEASNDAYSPPPAGAEGSADSRSANPRAITNARNNSEILVDENDQDLPNSNTRATLSMILTVVGDFYGQRDLLEFRETWPLHSKFH